MLYFAKNRKEASDWSVPMYAVLVITDQNFSQPYGSYVSSFLWPFFCPQNFYDFSYLLSIALSTYFVVVHWIFTTLNSLL